LQNDAIGAPLALSRKRARSLKWLRDDLKSGAAATVEGGKSNAPSSNPVQVAVARGRRVG
jgi:hypothetical protein